MQPLYVPSTKTQIRDKKHRYVHPTTREVYGGTDYDNPEKLAEIGAIPLTDEAPPSGYLADGWEIVAEEGGYVRRPTSVSLIPPPDREAFLAKLIVGVDELTATRIVSGFEINGRVLSSSVAAQSNFVQIDAALKRGDAAFPMPWSTLAGASFEIQDQAEWDATLKAKDTHVFMTEKMGGMIIRAQLSAMTIEQLQAWVDPRLPVVEEDVV